jgi:hypothetical protein
MVRFHYLEIRAKLAVFYNKNEFSRSVDEPVTSDKDEE